MTTQDFETICRLVRDRSAIVLEPGKEYLVEARLAPVARNAGVASISALIAQLQTIPSEPLRRQIVEAMVTTETSFFRDHHPFEALKRHILPELIRRRSGERRLNVWCAAASTGQEPYSIAILLREHFPQLATWNVEILATDLSAEILQRAQAGRYNQIEVNRGLPAALLVRYFKQHGATWELSEDVRRMVTFRELNLARPWTGLPVMDLIFMRNVMIYFDVETKRAILDRIVCVLRPDGFLLLGSAETTYNLSSAFERVEHDKAGFYQLVRRA